MDIKPIARSKLVDTIDDLLIVLDNHGNVIDLNPAALSVLKVSLSETIGKPASVVLTLWPNLTNRFSQPLNSPTEFINIPDINNQWYTARIYPLRKNGNNPEGYLLVLRDITEKQKMEAEHTRLATVVEQAHEAIFITDLDGTIVYANPYFETITGYSIDEALGKNSSFLQSGHHSEDFYADLWRTIEQGETWTGTFVNKRKDGTEYHEAATIFPIKNKEGLIANYATIKRDISVQVEAENAVQYYTNQLTTLHQTSIEISLAETFDELCRRVVMLGKEELGFDRLGLWFIDPSDPDYLIGTYGIDESGQLRDERGKRNHISGNPELRQFLHSKNHLLHLRNVPLRNDRSEIIGTGDRAIACIRDKGIVIGYISTDNLISREPISKQSLDLLVLYTQSVGHLSTQIRVTEENRRKAREQKLLNQITRIAIEQSESLDMLQTLADQLGKLFKADNCFITIWDDDQQLTIIGAVYGTHEDRYRSTPTIRPRKGEATITKAALNKGGVIIVDDVHNSPYLSRRLAQEFSASSIIGLPLIANQQKLGAALISFDQPHCFSEDEIALGEQAAQQIALAILKTRLLEQAEIRAREAEILRQASAAVAETLKRDETIERILEELNRVVPYDSASVQILVGDELEIVGERGFDDQRSILGRRYPISEGNPNDIVIRQGKPFILDDASLIYDSYKYPPHNHIRGWMGVPLIVQDNVIGMLALDSIQPNRFTDDHRRLATALADQVAIALENTRLFEETQWLATHDSLTGLFNRRHLISLAWGEFERAKRYNKVLSLIMLDIDHFKRINDTYGHLVGDQVLQVIANLCRNSLRINDLIGRYGGEEFVIVLPETSAGREIDSSNDEMDMVEPAKVVAERLRTSVEKTIIQTDRVEIQTTISLGIAEITENNSNIENLIDCADQALLQAKKTGRNRVVIWNTDR